MNEASTRQLLNWSLINLSLLFMSSCKTPVHDLNGMWVSADERYTVYFENDTFYSKYHYPISYKIEGQQLVFQDTIYTCECSRLPFTLEKDSLTLSLNKGVSVAYHKSAFNNTFDHHVHELGLELELQTGFSKDGLQSKKIYEFVYVGFEKDSSIAIILNEEKSSISKLGKYFSKPNSVNELNVDVALAVDQHILFTDFLKIHNAITKQDSVYVRIEHAIRNNAISLTKFTPYKSVFYEKLKILFVSQLLPDQNRAFDTLRIEVKNENEFIVNGQTRSMNNLPFLMKEHYTANSKNSLFVIHQTESLTYGQFLFIYSLHNKVILEIRDKYCLDNYEKTWQEIQLYDPRIEGSQELADSLRRHVQQEFQSRVLVDDL
jgi:biopolymer transport protein ExbD